MMAAGTGETELIEILRLSAGRRDDVVLGIGDDGAVLAPPAGRELVLATDTLVSGVHFPVATAAADLGWKALAVNLSDLAAMGAEPAWALLSLTLPDPDAEWVRSFADGFAGLARRHGVALVGGDTGGGDCLSVTVVAAGFVAPGRALTRAGAGPGDAICVTGELGDAAAALAALEGRLEADDPSGALRSRLDRPEPRVKAGLALSGVASAAIDVSDGLDVDLGRLLAASGCGGVVALDDLPASGELAAAVPDASTRRGLQMGGDDYELCFTLPARRLGDLEEFEARAGCRLTHIGEITPGPGLAYTLEGRPAPAPGSGWRHFGDVGDA